MPNLPLEILNVGVSLVCMGLIHWQTKQHGLRTNYSPERIGLFDALKGVCIVGVLLIHAAYLTPVSTPIYRTLDFAVPFFFVSSGFLLSVRCNGRIDLKEYYQKLFFRVLLIYLIFVIGTRIFKGGELTVRDIFLDALLGRTNYNYYFIPIILQLYILFPYLIKFREKFNNTVIFCLIAAVSFLSYIGNHYIEQPDWNTNPWYLVFIGKDFAYFCFGIFLSQYEIRKIRFRGFFSSFMIFLAGTLLLIFLTGEYRLSYAYPFAAFMFALVLYNIIKEHQWLWILEDLGRYSLVVYLVHSTIQRTVVMKYFYIKEMPWGFELIVVVGTTLMLSYAFARMFMAVYGPATAYLSPIGRRGSVKK